MDFNQTRQDGHYLAALDALMDSVSHRQEVEEIEHEYLRSISRLIPAHATAIYLFRPSDHKPQRIAASGVDEGFLSYYEKTGRSLDPLRTWIMENRCPNQSQLLLGLKGWQHHPIYQVVGTAEIDFAMQAPVLSDMELVGTLNFGRTVQEGAFTSLDLNAISIVSRFLGLAIAHTRSCPNYDQRRRRICGKIELAPQGVIIADAPYSIQYANRAARDIAARALGADSPVEHLVHMVREDNPSEENRPQSKKRVSSRSCPLPGALPGQALWVVEESPAPSLYAQLRGILSRREIDVLELVAQGKRNQDVADRLCISTNTVKRHLDNIYCKLNVNTRTELVARVHRLLSQD